MRLIIKSLIPTLLLIFQFPLAEAQDTLTTTLPLVQMNQSYTVASHNQFTLQGLTFTPVDSIRVHWDVNTHTFSVYGNTTIQMGGGQLHISFGTAVNPRLYLTIDTVATEVELQVTGNFAFKGLPFIAISDSTDFRYDLVNKQFEISGYATMVLDGTHYKVGLGTDGSPGVIDKNNSLHRVVVNVHDQFAMHGLVAANANIVLSWFPSRPTNTYYGHGDVSVKIEDGYFHAFVGTNSEHGITVVSGKVTDVSMFVVGGALLFGALPTYDQFKLSYDRSRSKWYILGEVVIGLPFGSLLNVPTLKMQTGTTSGIVYHTDTQKFNVDSATFSIISTKGANISIGGFALINLSISIHNNVPVGLSGFVLCPPGFTIGAEINFNYTPQNHPPFMIQSLGLEWEAQTMATAVPMGDSGFSAVKISGRLDNLDKPAELTFSDTLGLIFGELISIKVPILGTRTVAPAYFQADAVLSAHSLNMSVSGDFGATLIANKWQGLLGGGTGTLDLEFGKSYSFTGTYRMPSDPLLTASATMKFSNSGDFDLLAKGQLVVPHYIPIIGGKTFGSVDGAIRLKNEDPHNSFAAGWTKINLGFDHVHIGALFNIATHEIKKIGAAAAKAIEATEENDMITPPPGSPPPTYYLCSMHHDFTINSHKPAAYLQNHLRILNTDKFIDPHPNDSDHNIYVTAKILSTDPSYPNLESYRPTDTYHVFPASSGLSIANDGVITIKTNIVDSVAWIAASHGADIYGVINWYEQPEVFLTPGTHTMIIQGYCPLNEYLDTSDFSFTTSPAFPRPTVDFSLEQMYGQTSILYSNYLTDSTVVELYWSPDTTKNGYKITGWPYFWGIEVETMPGFRLIDGFSLKPFLPLPPQPHDTIYFYAVVNDYVNPPAISQSVPFSLIGNRQISGTITMMDGTPAANIPVLLSRESLPGSKITTKTDANGYYAFYAAPHNDDVLIEALAPAGHYFSTEMEVSMDFEARELQTPDWLQVILHTGVQDDSITANFKLSDQPVAVYGAVYDSNYVSIPGAFVYVLSESGSILATQFTTESGFMFFNLPTGKMKLGINLPTDDHGYHWLTKDIIGSASIKERLDSFAYVGTPLKLDYNARHGLGPFFQFLEANTNKTIAGGSMELINPDDPMHPLFSITSQSNGLVSFDEQDLIPDQPYTVIVTPPAGYSCQNNSCMTSYTWNGSQQFVQMLMTKN